MDLKGGESQGERGEQPFSWQEVETVNDESTPLGCEFDEAVTRKQKTRQMLS